MKKTLLSSLLLLTVLTVFAQNIKINDLEMPKRRLSLEASAGFMGRIDHSDFLKQGTQITVGLHYQVDLRSQVGIAYTTFSRMDLTAYKKNTLTTKGIGFYVGSKLTKHWKMELGAGYLLNSSFSNNKFVYKRRESMNVYGSFSLRRYFLYDYLSIGLNGNFSGSQIFDTGYNIFSRLVLTETYLVKSFTLSLGVKL
jgi:hypothetical protein